MIQTYKNNDGGKVKVFFVVEDGDVVSVKAGNQVVPTEQGFQFYVDDYVAYQIHKCELYIDGLAPKIRVRKGETLFIPNENEHYKRKKEIAELEEKLKKLKGDEDNEI